MTPTNDLDVYEKIGVRRIINAQGNRTAIGGSTPSELVKKAMEAAETSFVDMAELLDRSGEYIADILGVEAAYVTSGCSAALALATAACMAGNEKAKIEQLPDTMGMKNEVIIQKKHRYTYDRSYNVPGATLVEVGGEDGCTPEQLKAAIRPNTAAIAYLVGPEEDGISLEDAVDIAHSNDTLLIADAAAQLYPLDYFLRNARTPDIACFGAKYLGATHSAGFLCGRKDLVQAASANGFIAFQTGVRGFGRPMKVDCQEIVGVLTAIDAWFHMNHEDRLLGYEAMLSSIQRGLHGLPHVDAGVSQTNTYYGVTLKVRFDADALGLTAEDAKERLAEGDPSVWVLTEGDDTLLVNAHTLNENEQEIVAESLRRVLAK